jgi:hypothetical protein
MKRLVLLALALCVAACATYREDLNRGQRLYEENEYEHALAIWRVLEEDMDSLSLNDQARYAYLRGMTDFRLGFRPDARHWLAIARAVEQEHPGGLSQQWKQRLDEALTDLNRDVYGGAESLSDAPTDAGAPPPVTGAAGAASVACTRDVDCAGGQSCLNGVCVAAPPAP